jgi:hypothetical protein
MEDQRLMAAKEEENGKKGGGWIKTFLGMIGGLLSGAVVMYFSAWLNIAVKPAKPVPNFRVEHEGYNVRFQNLSPGFQGWWDFGDGTELLPASGQDSVTHKYERPGDYSVKLSLTNLFGEENDRTVPLHVEDAPAAVQPHVLSLTAERVGNSDYAPVMYHITAKTENAPLCLLDLGDANKDAEVVTDGTASLERYATYDKGGDYVVKLRVVNGTATAYQTEIVSVQDAPAGAVQLALTAVDSGTDLKTRTQSLVFNETFRADVKGEISPLASREHPAALLNDRHKEWVIRDVQLKTANGKEVSLGGKTEMPLDGAAFGAPGARNLRLVLSPDRSSIHLAGELVRQSAGKGVAQLPTLMIQGTMTEEIRKPEARTVPLPAYLQVPAAGKATTEIVTLPPLPKDWVNAQPRKLSLAVWDAGKVATSNMTIPGKVQLTLQNHPCLLTATPFKDKNNKDQVRVDLVQVQARVGAK